MDDITLEALEYPLVLQELKGFTSTPVGAEAVLNLRPLRDFSGVEEAFKELKESSAIVDTSGGLPLSGVEDIRPIVKKTAPEGACLKPSELLDVKNTLGAVSGVSAVLTPAFTGSFPLTSARIGSLSDYKDILKELDAILDAKGEIKDDASSRLFRLRKDIRSSRARARSLVEELSANKKFKEFLRDEIFTIRDDRYVLCVEASQHTRLPGVVHGRSGSGLTYYIEPLQAVELNNRLAILKKEEVAEEMEILKRATGLVSAGAGEIQRDLKTIASLDSVQARARFKEHLNAVLPGLSPAAPDVAVRFINARHPLLVFKELRGGKGGEGGEAVTPVDIILEKGESVLVISGANTGGKTVALKTLGLMSLMVNSGMAVPADEGSEAVFFNNIFADIGDRQNIAESLSTFSAHLKRTGEILERSAPGTLVLVDEIGVGTDPSEGGALALAFLEALKKRGARTAVTTHLNVLKAHAHSDPSFQNASVAFDEDTLKPLYKLRYGTPGASLALTVARSLGISEELIESAAEKLKGDEGAFVQSIEALQRETESLSDAKRRLEELEERREKALERLRKDRTKMLEKAKKMVEEVVKGAREEIRDISARFEEEGVKVQKAPAIKAVSGVGGRVAKLLSSDEGGRRFVPEVGDSVEIEGIGAVGEVIRVDGEGGAGGAGGAGKKVELLVGGMKVWIALERLRKGNKQKPGRKRTRPSVEEAFTGAGPGPTVNLIGMRVDEALQVVEKAIDMAHMEGIDRVEVIHGIGTGSLARAVGEYLKSNELVKSFNPGDTGAVTVVEIA